jgi:hypothetical protein
MWTLDQMLLGWWNQGRWVGHEARFGRWGVPTNLEGRNHLFDLGVGVCTALKWRLMCDDVNLMWLWIVSIDSLVHNSSSSRKSEDDWSVRCVCNVTSVIFKINKILWSVIAGYESSLISSLLPLRTGLKALPKQRQRVKPIVGDLLMWLLLPSGVGRLFGNQKLIRT